MSQVKLLLLYYALATLFTGAVYGTVADADLSEVGIIWTIHLAAATLFWLVTRKDFFSASNPQDPSK